MSHIRWFYVGILFGFGVCLVLLAGEKPARAPQPYEPVVDGMCVEDSTFDERGSFAYGPGNG